KESGNKGIIIVAGDGDVVQSIKDPKTGDPLPLGEDPFFEGLLANRTFIQNAINYLIDPEGIISTRTKQFKIRLLDEVKIREHRNYWYLVNIGLPLGIIILVGSVKFYWRKNKFEG